MDRRSDTGGLQLLLQLLPLGNPDSVDVKYVPCIRRLLRALNTDRFQEFGISPGMRAARLRPLLQVLELYTQNRALKTFHSVVETLDVVVVLRLLSDRKSTV